MNGLFSSLHLWSTSLLNGSDDPIYTTTKANERVHTAQSAKAGATRYDLFDATIYNKGTEDLLFKVNGESAVIAVSAGESFEFHKNIVNSIEILGDAGQKFMLVGFYDD